MPEGWRRRSSGNAAGGKRPSSASSLSGMVDRGLSAGRRGASCASVDDACRRPASPSLWSSASSASLRDASRSSSSSSSSSSLPGGAGACRGSHISLELTPLAGAGTGVHPGRPSRTQRVLMEIVETEQAYVRDLKSIAEDYLGCIIDRGALPLKPEQVSGLFCNIEDIYEFNSELLEDLERNQHAAAAIADCFVERSEAFDIYTLYCMNYPNSVSVLRECMKDQILVRFFHERQATLNHSLPLETYLLKPVQRILKYHLLLQELSKHLDKNDPGYEVVEDAIITMTAVAWYINDMKRKQEHAVRLQEIESLLVNWSGPDLSGFGELVLEASFKVQRVKKERAFFLFDKMLLIAKKRDERFVYSTHIFCCNLLLVDTLKDPLCFRVSDLTIPKQQHVVQAKNMEEKRLWVHYLKKLIVENHPNSLPHKARQVLGDNSCQSPPFESDQAKKFSCTLPRMDDAHAYHRGRRQSEPPEVLMYTPEKSRKSLPMLLEGNLPYRRARRQSAPAKEIEATLLRADAQSNLAEDPLDRADVLESGSTAASALVRVEAEREMERDLQWEPEEDNEEEDLAALCVPPTVSITEEILELINQSRAKEGLLSKEQVMEPPSELPFCQLSNFTCPLPPLATGSEHTLFPDLPREEGESGQDGAAAADDEKQTSGCQKGFQSPAVISKVLEDGERVQEEEQQQIGKRSGEDNITPPMDLLTESSNSISHPENTGMEVQRGSALTRGDKKIIEKIRSYYEAAAELEDDTELPSASQEEEEEDEEGTARDSPSPFASHHLGEVEKELETRPEATFLADPAPPVLAEDCDHGHADGLPDLEAGDKGLPDENSEELLLSPPSNVVHLSEVGRKMEDANASVCGGSSEEQGTEGVDSGKGVAQTRDGQGASPENLPLPLTRTIHSEGAPTEPEAQKGRSLPGTVSTGPPGTGSKQKKVKSARNLQAPGQIKLRPGFRQSRIVSTHRAFFEGALSDVTGMGLFEASGASGAPVVDPLLMRNSERILNKVQTLAGMYGAKAKAPSHGKRAIPLGRKAGDPGGPGGPAPRPAGAYGRRETEKSAGRHVDEAGTKSNSPADANEECQRSSQTEAKAHGGAEAQTRGRRDPSWSQNHTGTTSREDQKSLVERILKESNDVQKKAASTANPVEKRGFALCRPRDFIVAPNKEPEGGRPDDELPTSTAAEARWRTLSAGLERSDAPTPRSEAKEGRVYVEHAGCVNSVAQHSAASSGKGHWNASGSKDAHYQDKQDLPAAGDKHGQDRPSVPSTRGHREDPQRQTWGQATQSVLGSSGKEDCPPLDGGELKSCWAQKWRSLADVNISEPQRRPPSWVSSMPEPGGPYPPGDSGDCLQKFTGHKSEEFQDRNVINSTSVVGASSAGASPFWALPWSSGAWVSPDNACRSTGGRAPAAHPPTALSVRPPACAPSSTLRSPPLSPPVASSSVFTRSLAASCISQTLCKKNNGGNVASSPLQRCAPRHRREATDSSPPLSPSVQPTFYLDWQKSSPSPRGSRHPLPSIGSAPSRRPPGSDSRQNPKKGEDVGSPGGPRRSPSANVGTCAAKSGERPSFGSHNRMARPFSASEPNSRVPSPCGAVSPASLARLRSPPRFSSRATGPSSSNPLGLRLEIPEASSATLSSLSRGSPQMASPPAIGVPLWFGDIAVPKARNPQSPPGSFSSGDTTFSSGPSVSADCSHLGCLRAPGGSFSNPWEAAPSRAGGPRSRVESSQRAPGFGHTLERQSSRRGGSSCDASPAFFRPPGALGPQAPPTLSPSHRGHGIGQAGPEGAGDYNFSAVDSSSSPVFCSPGAEDWARPPAEQRSHLICAYVGGPPRRADSAPSCVVLSLPPAGHPQVYQVRLASPGEAPHVESPASPPARRSPGKAANGRTSYATTVNLQIAGSGRITSFGSARVSVSQTPPGELQAARRPSVNGPSYSSSAVSHNCGRL
ncbi:uncharacterized protein plekhg2 [Stigmatopora nigra]